MATAPPRKPSQGGTGTHEGAKDVDALASQVVAKAKSECEAAAEEVRGAVRGGAATVQATVVREVRRLSAGVSAVAAAVEGMAAEQRESSRLHAAALQRLQHEVVELRQLSKEKQQRAREAEDVHRRLLEDTMREIHALAPGDGGVR